MTVREKVDSRLFKLRMMGLPLHPTLLRRFSRFARACRDLGIPAKARRAWSVSNAELVFCYTVADLDYPFSWPRNISLVGAMVPPLPQAPHDTELSRWLDNRDSVVYIGLGTLTRLTGDQVQAFANVARRLAGDHHVLWKLPKSQQRLLPPSLPSNLRIVSWVPSQLDVLAHRNVKVFVNHGGSNGFHEGLYFGKPLLVRPLWADCHDQAVRTVDAGVGLTLPASDVDVDATVGKINRLVTEDSFAERARHFGLLQRQAGGRDAAADQLLGLPALR